MVDLIKLIRVAIIVDGHVENFTEIEDPTAFPEMLFVDIGDRTDVRIGDAYDEAADEFSRPAPPPVDPVEAREAFKTARASAVAAIRVTVGEMEFDGDEKSQSRMARAILAMQSAGVESTPWALADNSVADVTLADLQQALVLAGLAQTALWMPPE